MCGTSYVRHCPQWIATGRAVPRPAPAPALATAGYRRGRCARAASTVSWQGRPSRSAGAARRSPAAASDRPTRSPRRCPPPRRASARSGPGSPTTPAGPAGPARSGACRPTSGCSRRGGRGTGLPRPARYDRERDVNATATLARSSAGQVGTGPSGCAAQSNSAKRCPISPPSTAAAMWSPVSSPPKPAEPPAAPLVQTDSNTAARLPPAERSPWPGPALRFMID
jgi:hypothetical protein